MTIKLNALQPIVEDDRTMSKVFRTWALQVSEIEGGATGPAGPTGEGVPAGGIKSQHLTKVSGTDYDTEWSGDGQITHPTGPDFTYTSGDLTRIDYDGGEYKLFTYTSGVLTRVDYISNGLTKRKDFTYGGGGELDYITQSFV